MRKTVLSTTESMLFYFLSPALVGFAIGWQQAGFGQYMSKWASVVQWILHFETFWLLGFVALFCANILYKKFKVPAWVIVVIATILTVIFVRPIYFVNYELMVGYALQSGADLEGNVRELVIFEPSLAFFSMIATLYMHDMVLWPLVCGFILKYGKFPFGILSTHADQAIAEELENTPTNSSLSPTKVSAPFLRRLKPELGTNIRYLKAEGHYVLTKTDNGEDLVYYRFGDAIIQLNDQGIQVHRSYWVSNAALADEGTIIKGSEIHMSDGVKIPIGSTFLQVLKEYA